MNGNLPSLSLAAGIGVPPNPSNNTSPIQPVHPQIAVRPYVRVEICSSIVPGSGGDLNRDYLFAGGVGLADLSASATDSTSGIMQIFALGAAPLIGQSGINRIMIHDSLTAQQATVRLLITDLTRNLLRLIRPMDHVKIILTHPLVPTPTHEWLLFDGVVHTVRNELKAGTGYSNYLVIQVGNIQTILAGACFNWQGYLTPSSSIFLGEIGNTLIEKLLSVSMPIEQIIKPFIQSALFPAMGILIGDWKVPNGITIPNYVQFSSEWKSVPNSYVPSPWPVLCAQPSISFWQLMQNFCEPYLHEFFCRFELLPGQTLASPVLVHRPRPFPGFAGPDLSGTYRDSNWYELPVTTIQYTDPLPWAVDEELNAERHPNVVHWGGTSMGDQSNDIFFGKLHFGYVISNDLVNRFGFDSIALVTRAAALAPGEPGSNYQAFCLDNMKNFAYQEFPLCFLRTRHITTPFLPVRPGEVLEDYSMGATVDNCTTGYINATDFSLIANNDDVQMRMEIQVERSIWGTNAANYPDKVRSLVADIKIQKYAGTGIGPLPPSNVPDQAQALVPVLNGTRGDADPWTDEIKAAASRNQVPAWTIAHILQNETGLGRDIQASSSIMGMAAISVTDANWLISQGFLNQDGTTFKLYDRGHPSYAINACAAIIVKDQIGLNPRYLEATNPWCWVFRAYHLGLDATNIFGAANNWTLPGSVPESDEQYDAYGRYWSVPGVAFGFNLWSYLDEA